MLDPSARPRAGVWKREEARSGVGDLDADCAVGGLDAECDDVVLSEPGVPDGVGDELARQQRGDELEVLVPVQLGRTRNRPPREPGGSDAGRELNSDRLLLAYDHGSRVRGYPMSTSEKRLALNEALFRETNERLEERVRLYVGDEELFGILCECASIDCNDRITLTRDEYAAVRSDPTQFAVEPGHTIEDIEEVVLRTDRYEVVRKQGVAAEVAELLDEHGPSEPSSSA